MKNNFRRFEQLGGTALLVFVLLGCGLVLRPFITSILWAGVLCFSTWPLFQWVLRVTGGRRNLSAGIMTLLIGLVLVIPFAMVGVTFAENLKEVVSRLRDYRETGLPELPGWVARLPLAGEFFARRWHEFSVDTGAMLASLKGWAVQWQGWLVARSFGLLRGIGELSLSVLIAFFMYQAGETLMSRIAAGVNRVVGDLTQHLLTTVGSTVKGVVYGVLGTAIAQGALQALGFYIAGLPSPLLFGMLTFFLSLVPFGPPLVWVPATISLFANGHTGWGGFLAVWGLLVVSGVDNLLKPYLISREARLPFILVFLGVIGGLVSFGFIGVFIGPVLLAMMYRIILEFTKIERGKRVDNATAPPSPEPTP
ncbi:MAG: AI-2E family transporter [Kiritimatiellia bacterium]